MSGIKPGKKSEKGTPIGAPASKPKANLGEGHSAKSNNTDFADLREWYAKLDHDTRSAMDKAADKPDSLFTNEERDSFYRNVDPYHYIQYLQFRYRDNPLYVQDRMKSYYGFRRQLEENGLIPKKPSEVKPETQYAEQAVKEQVNSKKPSEDTASDDPWAEALKSETPAEEYRDPNAAKYASPEFKKKPLDEQWDEVLNDAAPKPETQAAKQMVENTKEEKATSTDDAESLWDVEYKPHDNSISEPKPVESKTGQPTANPERQAAQDMVDNSYIPYEENTRKQIVAKPANYSEFTEDPSFDSGYHNLLYYANGVFTPRSRITDLNYSGTREASNYPTRDSLYLDGQYPFEAYDGMGNVEFVPMYNPHYPRERLFSRPEDYYPNPFEKRRYDVDIQRYPALTETQRKLRDTAEVLGLGLGSIGLVGYIGGQQAQEKQKQAQSKPALEQQYALQGTSPFDYAKAANLFDLYSKYGSLNNEESIAEAINESVSPQVLSNQEGIDLMRAAQDAVNADVYRRYLDRKNQSNSVSSQESSEIVEAPEDLNVAPEAQAVKDTAQSAYGRALKRNKSASVIAEEPADPIVLNVPKQRKTTNRINSQNAIKQAVDVSRTVNNNQKPEAALAQSLLRARQESRASRDDARLQRYRYQSLLNSGLRGMTPDEAIRSGLLTPEQVQVLMRGPY